MYPYVDDDLNQGDGAVAAGNSLPQAATDRLLRAALATADGWWEWDLNTGEAWYSDAFAQMLDVEPHDLQPVVSTWHELIHPLDQPEVNSAIEAHLLGGPPFDVQFRMQTRGGGLRWFRSRGRCTHNVDGRPYLVSGNLQDIHAHKLIAQHGKTQAQLLVEQQRMDSLNTMAGGVAHEFNNLLQVMQGYVQCAVRRWEGGGNVTGDLMQAQAAIDRAIRLNREFLSFCRAGVMNAITVDLNQTMAELAERLCPVLPANIHFATQGCEEPLLVKVHEGALHEALLNLGTNARDAMPDGGELIVRCYPLAVDERNEQLFPALTRGAYACLAVSDTGEGIDPERAHRVWEPFYTTKDPSRGSGLGLAQVYSFAHQHRGAVGLHSRPHRGTTIRIYLPLIDEPGFQTVSADHADIVPPTAIVCTSDNLLADTLLKVLAPTGGVVISVDCAELLWGALERWDGAPAWVLLDCDEPEALGASLQERWPQLPIACFTGFDPLSSVSPASFAGNERWGPAAVVEKPFDSAMLLRALLQAGKPEKSAAFSTLV